MAEAKILIEGYTSADIKESEGRTCPTMTLIRDGNNIIITDPGVLPSQEILKEKLKEEELSIDDINFVFLTHSHLDHYRNVGMFPCAKVLEYFGIWDGDKCDEWQEKFSKDIKIINTPGHNSNSLTFLVKTKRGTVAICGDVFWKENYPKNDPYASDPAELSKSRKKVLQLADYIIPGHGEEYKVNK